MEDAVYCTYITHKYFGRQIECTQRLLVENTAQFFILCTLEIISNRSKGMSLKTGKVAKNLHMSGATVSRASVLGPSTTHT